MCIDLYLHNTCREHDTRHLCILNPITGYTVYSPWQDPILSQRCEYPSMIERILPHESCPFHPGCCRLEQQFLCWSRTGECQTRVRYHHFVDEDESETNDVSFLDAYLGFNPSLLFIVAWCFKAGVELKLADTCRRQILERLAITGQYGDGLHDGVPDTSRNEDLYAQLARLSHVDACAREVLGQFAMLWDLNTAPGALPPRPGLYPDPEQNVYLSMNYRLRVEGWFARDRSQFPWPQLVRVRPELRAGLLPINDDPAVVQWGVVGVNPGGFDPVGAVSLERLTLGKASPREITHVVYNPGTPVVYSPSFATVESASSPSSPPLPSIPSAQSEPESSSSSSSTNDDGEFDEEIEYPVEAIVDHRPHGVPRSRIQAFKVRWEGEWPPNEKETWQRRSDIAKAIIDEYWNNIHSFERNTAKAQKRRHRKQLRGEY
ncbi:hypothetical protein F4804DRAFT_68429 [Jackrogersella minutella]|nr:hypothetical protein F4804DRAFT_68429 [Jackrogersella minutella]